VSTEAGPPSAAEEMADLQAYDDLAARVYGAGDVDAGTRELALALAWLQLRDPERETTTNSVMRRVCKLLGKDAVGRWRALELFAADAPRYEMPSAFRAWSGPCAGPRLRAYRPRRGAPPADGGPRVCGTTGSIRVREWDLESGHVVNVHFYCRRHEAEAKRVEGQIAAGGKPPARPWPNTGGRLARYFDRAALVEVYRRTRPGWEPPAEGLCVDDWPAGKARVVRSRGRRLAVFDGGTGAAL
jgi:hypothetical protein